MRNHDTVRRVRLPGVVFASVLVCAGLAGIAHCFYAVWMWHDLLPVKSGYRVTSNIFPDWYIDALPTAILLLTSIGIIIAAFRHKLLSLTLLVWGIVAATVFFWFDLTNHNWQVAASIPLRGIRYDYGNWPGYYRKGPTKEVWGFIDKQGKFVIEPRFPAAGPFHDGLASFRTGATWSADWGYINKKGEVEIEPQFGSALGFSNGIARVYIRTNAYGFINKDGEFVIEAVYDEAEDFSEGYAAVKKGGQWGFIGRAGDMKIEARFQDATSFSEGLAAVELDEKWGYIDRTGDIKIEAKYQAARSFSEGLAAVKVGDKWGYIDQDGNFAVEPAFDGARIFSEGLAIVEKDKKYGAIDKTGQFVIGAEYDFIAPFSNGTAWGGINGEGISLDTKGNVTLQKPPYVGKFQEGLATAWTPRKCGYVNEDREMVIKPRFKGAREFSEGLAAVRIIKGALPRWVAYGIVIGSGVLLFAVYRRLGRCKRTAALM